MSDTKVYKMRQRPNLQQCPICFDYFSQHIIISHADLCCRSQQIEGESKKKRPGSQKKKSKKQNKNPNSNKEPKTSPQINTTTENSTKSIILKQEPMESKALHNCCSSQIKEKQLKQNEKNKYQQTIPKNTVDHFVGENLPAIKILSSDSIIHCAKQFDVNVPEPSTSSISYTNSQHSNSDHQENNLKHQNTINLKLEVVECDEQRQAQVLKGLKFERVDTNNTISKNNEKVEHKNLKKRTILEAEINEEGQKIQSSKTKDEQPKQKFQNKKRKVEKNDLKILSYNSPHRLQDTNANHQSSDLIPKTPISKTRTAASSKCPLKSTSGENESNDFNKNSKDSNSENYDSAISLEHQKQALEYNSESNYQQDIARAIILIKKLKERLNLDQVSQLLDVISSAKWYHLNANNSHEKIHEEVMFHFKELVSNDNSLIIEFNFFYHGFLGWLKENQSIDRSSHSSPSNVENEIQLIPNPGPNIEMQCPNISENSTLNPGVNVSYSFNTTVNIQGEYLARSQVLIAGTQQNPTCEIPITFPTFQQINHPRGILPNMLGHNYYHSKENHINLDDRFLISNNPIHQNLNILRQQIHKPVNNETGGNNQQRPTQLSHFLDHRSQLLTFPTESQYPTIIQSPINFFPNSRNFELNSNTHSQIHEHPHHNMYSNFLSQGSINQPIEQRNWIQQNRPIRFPNFFYKPNHHIQSSSTFNFNPNVTISGQPIQTSTPRSNVNRSNNFNIIEFSNRQL